MQQLLLDSVPIRWYFAFGAPQKTSLSIQFCRQNRFQYFNNPSQHDLINCQTSAIIQGPLDLFYLIQKHHPQLCIIYFGQDYSNQQLNKIRKQYQQIGKCKDVVKLDHISCQKELYPNLIFFYGPIQRQNQSSAKNLALNIQYRYSQLPNDPNQLIQNTDKGTNYIVNGLFTNPQHINILQQYFNICIIHFKYNREDLPKLSAFFDEEHDLLPYIQGKDYYIEVKGDDQPLKIMENIGIGLCPQLIFINQQSNIPTSKLVQDYIQQTDGLLLNIEQIQKIKARKGFPLLNEQDKIRVLTQIIYQNLNRKEILFTGFPKQTYEFVQFQNLNRKFTYFIDLTNPQQQSYSQDFSSQIYFLEEQKRISPSFDLSLRQQLQPKIEYWVINGPGTCGKTSVAKYIASEFGYKLIQFQTQAAAAKQKIATPQDGDEVPMKKYVAYFANIIKNNPQNTYIFDYLPYTNADLQLWIKEIGCPNVINLRVQPNQLVKRMRKKAESDLTAQVTQQQTAKVNENIQKNSQWIQSLGEYGPSSKIFQVDYSYPQILAQNYINSILKPRIFLAQRNNHLLYQNIAIKYGMGFVNLRNLPLQKSAPLVKKCGKRDIIICNYGKHHNNQVRGSQRDHGHHHDLHQKLVSEDMYWIEKNLGQIRYLGIWEPQEIQIKQKYMKLERPPEPVKPKPAEGEEEGKQQQPPAQDEQGKPKKVFDIYEYQWTQPQSHKNLSQWFFKLKKKVFKRTNDQRSCFDKFKQVLDTLNNDKDSYFYEVINQ